MHDRISKNIFLFFLIFIIKSVEAYTLLNADSYHQTVNDSRLKIEKLIVALKQQHFNNKNDALAFLSNELSDIPYLYQNAMGEGDWLSSKPTYTPGAIHVIQDPVYRTDGFNCQTFVQVVLALIYSNNLDSFDKNILKIAYGAVGNSRKEIVHYYNRNNFIDADFNHINEANGWLQDVTSSHEFGVMSAYTTADLTRQNWFLHQQKDYFANVRVLTERNGYAMTHRFLALYAHLPFTNFAFEKVKLSYLPKESIAKKINNGYKPNYELLNKIPTPAVIEIVRDAKKWEVDGKNIKDAIGTELNVSHVGLLYRHTFTKGELIYQKISCAFDSAQQKICQVTPIYCQQAHCSLLMFVHATDSHPYNYYWYKDTDGNYVCSKNLPHNQQKYTFCNRVEQLPLYNYLTEYQYGTYWYMDMPSILGIHVEKLI